MPAFPPGNPRGPRQAPGQPGHEEDIEVEERRKTATPKRYKVIFHNDDYTTMEYVVEVLRRFFRKTETEALHIMLTVHKKGKSDRRRLPAGRRRNQGRRSHARRSRARAPPFS